MQSIVIRGVEVETELRIAEPCDCGACPLCDDQDAEALGIEAELRAAVAPEPTILADDPDSAPCGTCCGDGRDPSETFASCPECGGIGEVYDPGWRERVAAEWAQDLRDWSQAIDRDAAFQVATVPYTAEDAAWDTWHGLGYAMEGVVVPARWVNAYAAGRRVAEREELERILAWDEAIRADR